MSIKKSRQIYVGGYDREYFMDEMSNSHLINSIRQVRSNRIALINAQEEHGNFGAGADAAIACLYNDELELFKELASRENCEECC